MENYYCGDIVNTGNNLSLEDVVMYFNVVNETESLENLSNTQKRLLNISNLESFSTPDQDNLNTLFKMIHGEVDPILCKDALDQCCNNKVQIPTFGWDDQESRDSVNGVSVDGFESSGMFCIDMTGTTPDALAYPFGFVIKKENDEEILGKIMSTTNLMGKVVVYLNQTGYYKTTITSNSGAFDNEMIYMGGCEFDGVVPQQPSTETQTQTPTKTLTKTSSPTQSIEQPVQTQTQTQTPTKTLTKTSTPTQTLTPSKTASSTSTPNQFGGTWVSKATHNVGEAYVTPFNVKWRNDGEAFVLSAPIQYKPTASKSSIKGYVQLYEYNESNANLTVGNTLNGFGMGDSFGVGLSMNGPGTRVAVGAPTFPDNDDQSSYGGKVAVYNTNTNPWAQVGNALIGSPGDRCGHKVGLNDDGNRLLVAANYEDVDGKNSAGAVRVYDLVNNNWTQIGQDIYGEQTGEVLGYNATISGDGTTLVIQSSQYDTGETNNNVGRIQVYSLVNNIWKLKGDPFIDEGGKKLIGEITISHDGNTVTFGNHDMNPETYHTIGELRQYKFENNQWNQVGNDILLPQNFYAHRIGMSSDTKTIVVSHASYYDPSTDESSSRKGMTRVYRLSGNTWLQLGQDLIGETTVTKLGNCVDITNDGLRLAVVSNPWGPIPSVNVYDYEL